MTKKVKPNKLTSAKRLDALEGEIKRLWAIVHHPNTRMDSLEGGFAELTRKFKALERNDATAIRIKAAINPGIGESDDQRRIGYWKARALSAEEVIGAYRDIRALHERTK
jgi:hypothetical protein